MAETPALILQIDADLKQAMRDRNEVVKLTLRSLKTALTEATKASEDHTLDEAKVIAILQKEAKQRRDSAAEYEKAGDTERAAQELAELAVIQPYLPQQLSEQEVEVLARQAITETGATSQRELGKVMAALMPRVSGKADGKLVNGVVRRLLTGQG